MVEKTYRLTSLGGKPYLTQVNPTYDWFKHNIPNLKEHKGILVNNKDLYLWDTFDAIHSDVLNDLGIELNNDDKVTLLVMDKIGQNLMVDITTTENNTKPIISYFQKLLKDINFKVDFSA